MIVRLAEQILCLLEGRSPAWPDFRRKHIGTECSACGAKRRLDLHHITPYHVEPKLELSADNVITLCRRCHLLLGHFDRWATRWNASVVYDAAALRAKYRQWERSEANP